MTRTFFRYLSRIVLAGIAVWAIWLMANWFASAGPDEAKGSCGQGGLRCAVCEALGREDCRARALTGCPTSSVEYVGRFPRFKAKLQEQKDASGRWSQFRKEMEAIQSRSSVELCRGNLDRMKKVEAEILVAEACPGEPASAAPAKTSISSGDEVAMLTKFRDCGEARARSLGATIKQRKGLRMGEETSQLHSMNKEITKITTDSIELLGEFREQADEALQTKCWLRGRIRDCGL